MNAPTIFLSRESLSRRVIILLILV